METSTRIELPRGFGLLRATALNMANMVGVGPFITIPLMLQTMAGPQALLGWILGAIIAICDGMVWSELGAAWPGSGGSYRFLREAYGAQSFGRLMAFIFIWQFVWTGPLEIASGLIGFAQYATYVHALTMRQQQLIAVAVGLLALILLYRRISSVGKLTVTLWTGTILTMIGIVVLGIPHFSARMAFSFPPDAFRLSTGFLLGLGSGVLIAMYDYFGYYDVCFIGDEVQNPSRTIPRAILISVVAIAISYLAIETVIIGVVPWREAMRSTFIVSDFIQSLHGRPAALVFTGMILWTAFASVFALLLGYSRIPFTAARDGYFFRVFGRLHPTGEFPHVSLLVLGAVSVACAFLPLDVVIVAMVVTRVPIQFIAQIVALPLLRRRYAGKLPYRMWLYPLPAILALAGWIGVMVGSILNATAEQRRFVEYGFALLAVGIPVFFLRARVTRTWPFQANDKAGLSS
jgi:basic amino acid/polyamine antiporter, APA family